MVGVVERPLFRVGLVSKGLCDGSKSSCDIPYKNNPKGPQNSFKMPLFIHYV
jgi:hypothetical protein